MQSIDQVFERATIRGIVDYLLFGIGPDSDERSYEERLEEPYMRFEEEVTAICAARRPLVRLPAATRRSPTATFIKVFR